MSRYVPFLDLQASYLELKSEIDEAVARVLSSGWYILGEEVENFESKWANYCNVDHVVGVANGLDALSLSLKALDVGVGDEVIVPSNTYIATWLAVSQCGAVAVPVEPDRLTQNIDVTLIERAITKKTKVIIPVHLYGQPADMDPILDIAHSYGLYVLEDAAQAHGARYKGRRIGGHGDIVSWSFYPGKNLGAFGDAGAISTGNSDIAERIRMLRNYGSRTKYVNDVKGVNSRLDPIQAAILSLKLSHLDEWNRRRDVIARRYTDAFSGLGGSEDVRMGIELPYVLETVEPVWHLYTIRVEKRDLFRQTLEKLGVGTVIHYPIPPHLQGAYEDLSFKRGDFPLAEEIADRTLSIPIGPAQTMDATDYVIECILNTLRRI